MQKADAYDSALLLQPNKGSSETDPVYQRMSDEAQLQPNKGSSETDHLV